MGGEKMTAKTKVKSNDQIILDDIISTSKSENCPDESNENYFEFFAAEQILKPYDLDYNELQSGIVGSGDDGGIDGIYLFINGQLIQEDIEDYDFWKKNNIKITLVIIQAKTSASFTETAVDKLRSSSAELFTLDNTIDELLKIYNEPLIEIVNRFRTAYTKLAAKFPKVEFSYNYVSKGSELHDKVKIKVDKLKDELTELFQGADTNFNFIGARDLLDLARSQPSDICELTTSESPIISNENGYIALVKLKDFYKILIDANGNLKKHIFESNVRDHQGNVLVNQEIRKTLEDNTEDEDFWWLNNGITIISASTTPKGGKSLIIESPEIVNGLQTTREIYAYFSKNKPKDDNRNVLIRIITAQNDALRDKIIKATNSQTNIPKASLRSTDRIHRNIEDYLKIKGLFYDRRKNFYKNQGKPRTKIISVQQMAQALMAIVLYKPDTARARPSTLLNNDDQYGTIFNEKNPIEIYYSVIKVLKDIDDYFKKTPNLQKDRANLIFYVAYASVCEALNKAEPSINEIKEVEKKVTESHIIEAVKQVKTEFSNLGATDKVAKGGELIEALKNYYKNKFPLKKT